MGISVSGEKMAQIETKKPLLTTMNGKMAIVNRVKANLKILAYMVKWCMTISAKSDFICY